MDRIHSEKRECCMFGTEEKVERGAWVNVAQNRLECYGFGFNLKIWLTNLYCCELLYDHHMKLPTPLWEMTHKRRSYGNLG